MTIRVVLAGDHYRVREGVRRLIETEPELEPAAVCEDLPSLVAASSGFDAYVNKDEFGPAALQGVWAKRLIALD